MVVQPPEGPAWGGLAGRPGLGAVLDPADTLGVKNRLIDRVHKRALRGALGTVAKRRVLDFGCGNGRLLVWLVAAGANVVGVDATPEMVEAARRTAPALAIEVFDGAHLPFADAAFDYAISVYVLQYYAGRPQDYARLLQELHRVLASGGRLAMIEQVVTAAGVVGGTREQYERGLVDSSFVIERSSPVRLGDSRIVGLAQRWPWLERVPLLDAGPGLEARRRARRSLPAGSYVDYLFLSRAI